MLKPARPSSKHAASKSPSGSGKDKEKSQPNTNGLITVFVATCQKVPTKFCQDDPFQPDLSNLFNVEFKAEQFTTLVQRTNQLEAVQRFLLNQWIIMKSPLAYLPIEEHMFTFKGSTLRLESQLDAYYIEDQDVIYLRFASLGAICNPCAMSTSELRQELQQRNAYKINQQPEQLMKLLQEEIRKESRLERLHEATRKEQLDDVVAITKEKSSVLAVASSKGRSSSVVTLTVSSPTSMQSKAPRPSSLQWPFPPCENRTVFLSIASLERIYQQIPRDALDSALFIFDTERKWVFDRHNALLKQHFDYHYMSFDKDFLEFLILKEEAGRVFWFRPEKSFEKLSAFLVSFEDPVTKKRMEPLMLKTTRWLTLSGVNGWQGECRLDGRKKDLSKAPKFTSSVTRIVTNLESKSFDYLAVQELLYQANSTLLFAPL